MGAPALAPLLASKLAIPAIGAVAGGLMAKKTGQSPLLGAALGGLGGYALGPAMGAMGASGAAGATPGAAAAYGAAMP